MSLIRLRTTAVLFAALAAAAPVGGVLAASEPLDAVASLAPIAPGPRLNPFPARGRETLVLAAGDAAASPMRTTALASPAALDSDPPGVCAGGANDGASCLEAGDCPGGVCSFPLVSLYENESSLVTWSTAYPRSVLDDIVLGGPLAVPPARIRWVEFPVFLNDTGGLPAGSTLRVEIRFWDTLATAASPVNSGYLGGAAWLVPGPLPHNVYAYSGLLPPGSLIAPSDPALAVQIDYRDDASGALAYGTVVFSNGGGSGPQTGSSQNLYYRDVDANGQFDPGDARSLAAPDLANVYLHLAGELPAAEAEPNDTPETATVTASCLALDAAIAPAGDVDWYRFSIAAEATLLMAVACGEGSDDSTLTLRDEGGAEIAFNDDVSAFDRCSSLQETLAAGTYFLEVHEKGDDAVIASYRMNVGPPPPAVPGLRWTGPTALVWSPLATGGSYDLIHGDLQLLHAGGLTVSTVGCIGEDLPSPGATVTETPGPGQGWWYLVRGIDPCTQGAGTYDAPDGGEAAPRDPQILPAADCNR
jgi:hypothetical protein